MQQVRVAILGQGRSGHDIHGYTLSHLSEQYRIVAVVDTLEKRRVRAEREYGCVAYADYRELFNRNDIDLVVNALPSADHVPVSLEFLNRGFHVLCEKPLARRVSEVDSLIAAARAHQRTLTVFQQSRFSPAFQKVKEIVESGVLGRIVQVNIAYNGFARRWDWQTLKAMNGGNLLNTGPHPLDQALQLFGTDVVPSVFCQMDQANSFGDAEDYVRLVLYGDNRPTINIEISSCCAYTPYVYHVQGTRGGLMGNFTHLDWKYFDADKAEQHTVSSDPLEGPDGSPAYCSETLSWKEESWDISADEGKDLFLTMGTRFYAMLHRTLTEGAELVVTPEQVRQQVIVIEECFRQNPRFAV